MAYILDNSLDRKVITTIEKLIAKSKEANFAVGYFFLGVLRLLDKQKVALAFLLGYYDGDGHYIGGRQATIVASSKPFLEHIKELFGIKNKVNLIVKPGTDQWVFDRQFTSKGLWQIYLGPEVFDMMMNSYEHSMRRKRRQGSIGSLNFLGDQT